MALLKIKNQAGALIGDIELSGRGAEFKGEYDHDFYDYIKDTLEEGVPLYSEDYEKETFIMRKNKVFPGEPLFEVAFRNFLTRMGFGFIEENTELEEKVRNLLGDIPDDDQEKAEILGKLPDMSNLEQTLLLRELAEE